MKLRFPNYTARRSSSRGFTMIEIAIALGVIAFALVAIMGILPLGMTVQRDNRFETIINQDATYWLEAIRDGAQHASVDKDDLTNYVERITRYIPNAGGTNPVEYFLGNGGMTAANQFNSTSDIISLLTNPYFANGIAYLAEADVRAISGSAGEKKSDVSFTYRMEVSLSRPDPVNAPTLWDLGLTMRWPVIVIDSTSPKTFKDPPRARKPLHYRTMVSRNVMTNLLGSVEYYQFIP
jgi:type II secretory pathway pseudopilin PulG